MNFNRVVNPPLSSQKKKITTYNYFQSNLSSYVCGSVTDTVVSGPVEVRFNAPLILL